MAIDTTNEKLAVMEWCSIWEPGLPISPSALDQADQQQLIWDFPGILWGEVSISAPAPTQAWIWDLYRKR